MSPCLLDVNVLISLIDPMHLHHRRAMSWFTASGRSDWLTCPITQNGVVRIVGSKSYPQVDLEPADVIAALQRLLAVGSHRFLPDNISLLDSQWVDVGALAGSNHVTDVYLLALAASAGATLATFDQRIATQAVPNGQILLIP